MQRKIESLVVTRLFEKLSWIMKETNKKDMINVTRHKGYRK